jgi:NADPH2:quinone reductase
MRAWQVVRHGAPGEALELVELAKLPSPGPGLVTVSVSAVSLNFNDIDLCYGRYPTIRPDLPFVLGMDLCGTVESAGPGLDDWLGRRIVSVGLGGIGTLAERAYAPADSIFEAPVGLDDGEAAAFFIPFHTMHLALYRRAALRAGETLLVHSGAGGLGSSAVQLGVAAGARVLATAGGPEKLALCRELGAEVVIDYREEDFVPRVLEATEGRGVEVLCDLVGGPVAERSWRCVAHEGRYLIAGFSSGIEAGERGLPPRPVAKGNFSLVGVMMAYQTEPVPGLRDAGFSLFPREVGEATHRDLCRLLDEKKIRPIIGCRVRFEDVPNAYIDLEARRTIGRTVVQLGRE